MPCRRNIISLLLPPSIESHPCAIQYSTQYTTMTTMTTALPYRSTYTFRPYMPSPLPPLLFLHMAVAGGGYRTLSHTKPKPVAQHKLHSSHNNNTRMLNVCPLFPPFMNANTALSQLLLPNLVLHVTTALQSTFSYTPKAPAAFTPLSSTRAKRTSHHGPTSSLSQQRIRQKLPTPHTHAVDRSHRTSNQIVLQ